MSVETIADKYMERGGYAHGERKHRAPEDMLAVASFIAWFDDGELSGGVRAKEAFEAFCRLADLSPVKLRKVIRPDDQGAEESNDL
ncbi:putative aminoglycoside phosphotransferase [Roseibium sp. TrichSKD4]|uniref:hypothetical protein n=1 Tax=Roseibium sp. TrichSKD4 TaxID=744980 RepID=UPI0001E56FDE|nr:hypothetical protein [Roseibium sp. TrichSKD4]EFO31367.1 putative aminoglycoside phosphotransferase [Roseibium sp. TrichSKD4]